MSENHAPSLKLTKCRENFTIPKKCLIVIFKLTDGGSALMTSELDSACVDTHVATLLMHLYGSMSKMSG